jgi:hypothetical protein
MMSSDTKIYDRAQVERIQYAYRSIFPVITPPLSEYWGLNRERAWSCLTSDFHRSSYDQLLSLHREVEEIDHWTGVSLYRKGEALREASILHGVGFSIGICPWTDNLLGETYSDDQSSATIILGHDWYPIVLKGPGQSESPLRSNVALQQVEAYWPAAPEAVLSASTVGLFFNLYPDFRPPGEDKCGNLRGYGYSYTQCLSGLDAMVKSICTRFENVKIISWGSNVWEALLPRIAGVSPRTKLSKQIQEASGQVLDIYLGGASLPYFPTMHPGHWGNFGRAYHLRHLKAGFAAMELGLPGPASAVTNKVQIARQIQ